EFVALNPMTGSGFLGVWVLPMSRVFHVGSSHSEYMDTFLRLGVIGSGAYLYLLVGILKFTYRHHREVFVGLVGVITYGLFHETFKESQGAFILAFLVGMYATYLR